MNNITHTKTTYLLLALNVARVLVEFDLLVREVVYPVAQQFEVLLQVRVGGQVETVEVAVDAIALLCQQKKREHTLYIKLR